MLKLVLNLFSLICSVLDFVQCQKRPPEYFHLNLWWLSAVLKPGLDFLIPKFQDFRPKQRLTCIVDAFLNKNYVGNKLTWTPVSFSRRRRMVQIFQ